MQPTLYINSYEQVHARCFMKIVDELGSNMLVKNHHCIKLYNNVMLKFLKLRIFSLAAEIV